MIIVEYVGGPFDGLRDEIDGVMPAIMNIEQAALLSPKGDALRDRWTGSYVYPDLGDDQDGVYRYRYSEDPFKELFG